VIDASQSVGALPLDVAALAQARVSPGESWSTGRIIAIAATVILLAGSLVAALVLGGGSDKPKPVAAQTARSTPEPVGTPRRSSAPSRRPLRISVVRCRRSTT
jgi:hypothetical protein